MSAITPPSGNAMMRAVWTRGDFGAFAPYTTAGDDTVFEQARVQAGERLLDAACGAGVLALRAARAGAVVTGIDIAANLVAQARERAQADGLHIQFDEGDVEALPYNDASFDTVVSQFGSIFAPHPEVVVAEMARVLKPGGRAVLFCWTPPSWVGRLVRTVVSGAPVPLPGPSPLAWGDETIARERLSAHFHRVSVDRGSYLIQFPFGPSLAMDFFLQNMGPVGMAYLAAPEGPARHALRQNLENFFQETNQGTPKAWHVASDFLHVEAFKD